MSGLESLNPETRCEQVKCSQATLTTDCTDEHGLDAAFIRVHLCNPWLKRYEALPRWENSPTIEWSSSPPMNICMITNTYLPHVGGVARSVSTFAEEFRKQKHQLLVVAPEFAGRPLPARAAAIVERVPAIQKFNGQRFRCGSRWRRPVGAASTSFKADIIHAHHPFLLGDTALRVATKKNVADRLHAPHALRGLHALCPFRRSTLTEVAMESDAFREPLRRRDRAEREHRALIKRRGVRRR